MKTAVVILNWNGRNYLEKFLPALVDSVEFRNGVTGIDGASGAGAQGASGEVARSEVIVADNASQDGSMDWLRANFPQVRTIVFNKNYGYTGGYNLALKDIEAEYYLLLNSDIEVSRGWLEPLEAWMDAHPDCGACAPKLLSYSERGTFEYAGAAGGLLDRYGYPFCRGRVMRRVERDEGQYDVPWNVFWASGACLCVRAELFRRLGGFDRRFFAHQEEIDLCWRIQLAGYKVTIVPQSAVHHVGGGTLPNDSPWKLELKFRNNLLMLDNNLATTYAVNYLKYRLMVKGGKFYKGEGKAQKTLYKSVEKAAKKGQKWARRTIYARMCFDGCSALAYLLSLRPKYFGAVLRAHWQFHRLRRHEPRMAVMDRLNRYMAAGRASQGGFSGGSAYGNAGFSGGPVLENIRANLPNIDGMFPKSIIYQHFWRGRNIFRYLRYKFIGKKFRF